MPGELRWYARLDDEDVEVGGPDPVEHEGEIIIPRSRTFIPAGLDDNPVLSATNYRSVLQAAPEPLRSQILYGDFSITIGDSTWQVIPRAWLEPGAGGGGVPRTVSGHPHSHFRKRP